MTADQIKHLVERFLSWSLPEDFNPDRGISCKRPNYGPDVPWHLTGTNLLGYSQAEAMVRHMIEGMPPSDEVAVQLRVDASDLKDVIETIRRDVHRQIVEHGRRNFERR